MHAPASHVALIALAVLLYAATLPFAIMHLDLARDIGQALAIVRGERMPLEGPVLASSVHAGPLWYYLLAIPLAAWPAWLSVTLWIGALAALKFPLAYVAGTRLVDRRTGLIWMLLLLFPGWMTFETIVQNHASLVATATLAVIVATLGYVRSGSRRYLALAGLLFGAALHAHPSVVGVAMLLAATVLWRARRASTAWLADLAVVAAATLVPFLPYLASQAASGWPDLTRAAAFVGDPAAVGSLTGVPSVLAATFVGGAKAVAADLLVRLPAASALVMAVSALLFGTCAYGIVAASREPALRKTLLVGIAATLVLAVSVTVLRAATPFYMTFVIWTIASGVIAAGLSTCERLPYARWVSRAALGLAVALIVATQTGVADTLRRGAYRFAFYPLFDVKAPPQPGAPMPFLVARAAKASGRFLCETQPLAVHGSYAVHLLHVYAMEMRLSCGPSAGVMLGGAGDHSHMAGVSRTIADRLGVAASRRLGPILLLPVNQIVNPRVGAPIPDPASYPPVATRHTPPTMHVFDFDAAQDEAVLVTDMYFAFVAPPSVQATANGLPVMPAGSDRVTTAFRCAQCSPSSRVRWQLAVTTSAIERVDVVSVRTAEPLQ